MNDVMMVMNPSRAPGPGRANETTAEKGQTPNPAGHLIDGANVPVWQYEARYFTINEMLMMRRLALWSGKLRQSNVFCLDGVISLDLSNGCAAL
jgi:hypothetical protein